MKTLVIGGGMSGLTYGIMSAKNGIETVVCEKNPRAGKKIAVTGNGKCNIGNANVSAECFNKSALIGKVLESVPLAVYERFLKSCGIYTYTDAAGRMYPLSESASNVVDCLRYQLAKYGGKLHTDCNITAIKPVKCGYLVQIGEDAEFFDKVVLACGSASSAAETNAKLLVGGENFTPLCPSLVPVKIFKMEKVLNGLRAKANVTLLVDGVPQKTEFGEVQFKEYGLSGICIYNLSAEIARSTVLGKKAKYQFVLDLAPNLSLAELQNIFELRQGSPKETLLYGILHNKLAECVLKRVGENPQALAKCVKNFTFDFDKLLDFSMSQVTAGGIREDKLNLQNLTLPNGVVAIGEVLNVDGVCGGNNLYFAAASALYLFDETQRQKAFEKQ